MSFQYPPPDRRYGYGQPQQPPQPQQPYRQAPPPPYDKPPDSWPGQPVSSPFRKLVLPGAMLLALVILATSLKYHPSDGVKLVLILLCIVAGVGLILGMIEFFMALPKDAPAAAKPSAHGDQYLQRPDDYVHPAYRYHPQQPVGRRWTNWQIIVLLFIAVSLIGAIPAFYGMYKTAEFFNRAGSYTSPGSPPTLDRKLGSDDTSLSKDTLNAISITDVAQAPMASLLNAYGPDFDNWRQKEYDQLVANHMTPEQREFVTMPTGDKANYSDQDILNQFAIDVADASTQDNAVEGPRMFSLVYESHCKDYEGNLGVVVKNSQNLQNQSTLLIAYKQDGPTIPHPKNGFMEMNFNDYAQVRLIHEDLTADNPSDNIFDDYGLYGLVKNGNNSEWRLVQRFDYAGNPRFQSYYDYLIDHP